MGFKRDVQPMALSSKEHLTADLAGIGILVASQGSRSPNIENTLLAASIEGMAGDFRTLGLLVDWLEIHLARVNADRLIKIVKAQPDLRTKAFWKAVAQWQRKDIRLKRLLRVFRGDRIELLSEGSAFLVKRNGEDGRFAKSCLLVPSTTLRHRPQDILAPEELVKLHSDYRYRVQMGSSYRADMWSLLEREAVTSSAELARRTFGSFATAWQVIRDWSLLDERDSAAS